MPASPEEIMLPAILNAASSKGGEKLLDLILARLFRKKRYLDALMEAKGRRDGKAIEEGRMDFDGKNLIPALELPNIDPVAVPYATGMQEEALNLHANIAITAGILKNTPADQVSDEPVNPDWFARWRREASLIGEPEMRVLWGRILAEEVKNPHAISLKTLDILKNITGEDARLFCKIVRYRINYIIPLPGATIRAYKMSDILSLQDLSLVSLLTSDIYITPIVSTEKDSIFICNGFVLFFPKAGEIALDPPAAVNITDAGKEILNVADSILPPTLEEIKALGSIAWDRVRPPQSKMIAYRLTSGINNRQQGLNFDMESPLHIWQR